MNKYSGLTDKEVLESRKTNGYNILEKKKKVHLINRILNIFKEPMFLLLIVASLIYFFLGEISDGIIMLVSVVSMICIETIQEFKTDKAIEALNILSSLNVKVIRNNKCELIDSTNIVVGDTIILEEGDKVPSDAQVLECTGLGINESILTGESATVYKTTEPDNEKFKRNICYMGTTVTFGSAILKVIAVGSNNEYSKIGKSLNNTKKAPTPLEKQINKLVFFCSIFSLVLCISVALAHYIHNNNIVDAILSGITVAMATIPEEIPVVLTVFLAMGAWRLAKHNVLVRGMKSVETLGALSTLCVDKTGTLTQNKMLVKDVFSLNNELLYISALACPVKPYDPMELAIQKYTFENGLEQKGFYNHKLIHEYIFNTKTKMMGQVWKINQENLLCVKGAYESVMPLCKLTTEDKKTIKTQIDIYASLGYRVIAVAKSTLDNIPDKINDNKLEFCGLIAVIDPPKYGVKESLEKCYQAGIRVIMITGDNGDTALGIASDIGLKHNDTFITGAELEQMSDKELQEKVKTTNIFARVYPNHKMRIVESLQHNGEVVAMTGDGVNDAPALKKAEIGIAMGKRGTDVAKEASDIILMDDNFNTIVKAVENGRSIYNNIVKAISYIFIIHIPIAFTSLIIPLFNYPTLLLPIHIVIMELIIDPTSSIILERIIEDKNIMNYKPRNISSNLISEKVFIKSVLQGLLVFIFFCGGYIYLINNNYSLCYATTFSFSMLILSNMFIVNVIQSDELMIKNLITNLKDKVMVSIMGVIILGLLIIIYVPFMQNIVGTCSLTLTQLLLVLATSLLCTVPFDILKIFKTKN